MLPKIDSPVYSTKIQSTGESVRVRPYTVKQEKILLIALESKDVDQIIEAILTVIQDCVLDDINVRKLPSFDVEGLFVAIRARSVGEKVKLRIKCEKCNAPNDTEHDLTDFELSHKPAEEFKVEISPTIGFATRYPSMSDIKGILDEDKSAIEQVIKVAAKCIDYVYDETQIYKSSETTEEEMVSFIESLSGDQFNKLREFVDNVPKITKTIQFNCTGCKEHNRIKLEGLQGFFT